MRQYHVVLLNFVSDAVTNAVVCADEGDTADKIVLSVSIEDRAFISESEQYFDAYQKLRDELLAIGYGLQCNGSLINAMQSALMAYTPKVYLVQMGKQALMKDQVNIWDYCDSCDFPTTAQQNAFVQDWLGSLQ